MHMIKFTISPVREMQIKTTLILLHAYEVAIITFKDNNKSWQGYVQTGILTHDWQKCRVI